MFNHETCRTGARGLAAAARCQLPVADRSRTRYLFCLSLHAEKWWKTWDKVKRREEKLPYLLSMEGEGRTINVRTPYVARTTSMHDV